MPYYNPKRSSFPAAPVESAERYDRLPAIPRITQFEFEQRSEELEQQRRGVQLEIQRSRLEAEKNDLRINRIKVGISALNVQKEKVAYRRTAAELLKATADAAKAQDNAELSIAEWAINQEAISQKVLSQTLSLQGVRAKNEHTSGQMKLEGVLNRFSARTA